MTDKNKNYIIVFFLIITLLLIFKIYLTKGSDNHELKQLNNNINNLELKRDSLQNVNKTLIKELNQYKKIEQDLRDQIKDKEKINKLFENDINSKNDKLNEYKTKLRDIQTKIKNFKKNYKNLSDDELINSIKNNLK